jgi:hypothetical protein
MAIIEEGTHDVVEAARLRELPSLIVWVGKSLNFASSAMEPTLSPATLEVGRLEVEDELAIQKCGKMARNFPPVGV